MITDTIKLGYNEFQGSVIIFFYITEGMRSKEPFGTIFFVITVIVLTEFDCRYTREFVITVIVISYSPSLLVS